MITVNIVFFRTATEILYIVHLGGQTEAYTDTGNFQFGSCFAGSIASGSKGSHTRSFGNFGFCCLHIRRSELGTNIYDTARIDSVSDNIQVAGS